MVYMFPLVLCFDNLQDDGLQDSSKIAAFDFDGCLAKTAVNMYVYIWSHAFLIIKLNAICLDVNGSVKGFRWG